MSDRKTELELRIRLAQAEEQRDVLIVEQCRARAAQRQSEVPVWQKELREMGEAEAKPAP